ASMNSAISRSSVRTRWCSLKRFPVMGKGKLLSSGQAGRPTILMTTDTVGGVWSFTLDLAEGLGDHGVEVIAAALGGSPSPEQRAEAARVKNLRVLASDFKLEWMDDPWRDVEASGRWLLDLER